MMNLGEEGCKKAVCCPWRHCGGTVAWVGGGPPMGWADMSLGTLECWAVALAPGNEVCLEPAPLPFAEFRGLVREMWLVAWGDLSLSLSA